MYPFILSLHNIVRWLVLIAALVAIVRAVIGWSGKREWTKTDNLAGLLYVSMMDLNVLLGLILYVFLSPLTTQAIFNNFGAAMSDRTLRFFAVEHLVGMVIALVLAHIGRSVSKKAADAVRQHRAAAIWFTISLLVILASIPWDRPFWRGLIG
jgi:uncharacterized membrane protein